MSLQNVFGNIPREFHAEITEKIFTSAFFRIERIVSKGHSSPAGFWYDQNENEWVLLLKGRAVLRFEDGTEIKLKNGDYINIPAHIRHRVEWTDPEIETIWLAVFY